MDCQALLDIIMSPGQQQLFADALVGDFKSIMDVLSSINVQVR